MATQYRLDGKVAIITGGASGIGEATSRLFVENGAFVVIADIQDDLGMQLANDIGGHAAIYKHCDVTVESDVEDLVALAVTKWGKLDIMYSNAGILGKHMSGMHDLDMANFDNVLNVNVRGMALALKHGSRVMIDAKTKGVIICTGSIASVIGAVAPIEYTVSKHALLGLMRSATNDLGKYGIRVNCVSPSSIMTPLSLNFFRDVIMKGHSSVPDHEIQSLSNSVNVLSGHTLYPIDVAQAVLYLASDAAAFVSGLNLVVDGGITATNRSFRQ